MKIFLMKRILLLVLFTQLITVQSVIAIPSTKEKKNVQIFISHFENVLGTSMEIKIKTFTENQQAIVEKAVIKEINRLSKILSAYDTNSEFSQWMKTLHLAVPISKELFEVFNLYDQWRLRSKGSLDASAQVISKLWQNAASLQQIPSVDEMSKAVSEVQKIDWHLDVLHQTATHLSNSPLVLNSFTKSYIIQHAAKVAMQIEKVQAIVVNIGGDIVVAGNLNETIQISNPKADAENDLPIDIIRLQNKSIATSGNYRRGELINGQWYSHIIDPRTGLTAGNIISATVVANKATDAGALATAFNILTPIESANLASTIPGVEYLIVTKEGERIKSKGWDLLTIAAPVKLISEIAKPDQWNPDFELAVNFELAQLPGFARRPFMAIWVEDADKKSVRTISIWFNKDRWLHELRAWYATNYAQLIGEQGKLNSITSATRSAGKYSVKWDGKDDRGNYVKPGKYTLNIEAVREHGTYQLITQEINCKGTPQLINLTGNVEVAAASLYYKKKADN